MVFVVAVIVLITFAIFAQSQVVQLPAASVRAGEARRNAKATRLRARRPRACRRIVAGGVYCK